MARARAQIVRLLLLAAVPAATGCYRPIFDDKAARTQFETYDVMRQRYVPMEQADVFGNPEPALRARLTRTR